jgi:hypothetical protein
MVGILYLQTKWRWVVSFILQPLYSSTQWTGSLVGHEILLSDPSNIKGNLKLYMMVLLYKWHKRRNKKLKVGGKLTHSLHGDEPFLRSLQWCSYSIIPQHFMEPKGSLPRSQQPFTGPYLESEQPSPCRPILSLRYILILSTHLCLGLFSWLSHPNLICIPLRPIRATFPAHQSWTSRNMAYKIHAIEHTAVCNSMFKAATWMYTTTYNLQLTEIHTLPNIQRNTFVSKNLASCWKKRKRVIAVEIIKTGTENFLSILGTCKNFTEQKLSHLVG